MFLRFRRLNAAEIHSIYDIDGAHGYFSTKFYITLCQWHVFITIELLRIIAGFSLNGI